MSKAEKKYRNVVFILKQTTGRCVNCASQKKKKTGGGERNVL